MKELYYKINGDEEWRLSTYDLDGDLASDYSVSALLCCLQREAHIQCVYAGIPFRERQISFGCREAEGEVMEIENWQKLAEDYRCRLSRKRR
jgi:hypothetical protein